MGKNKKGGKLYTDTGCEASKNILDGYHEQNIVSSVRSLDNYGVISYTMSSLAAALSIGSIYKASQTKSNILIVELEICNDADILLIPVTTIVSQDTSYSYSITPMRKKSSSKLILEFTKTYDQFVELKFVAITTNKNRLNPINYINQSIDNIYKDLYDEDVPTITITLSFKDQYLIFEKLSVNNESINVPNKKWKNNSEAAYAGFKGYISSNAPSFGVCFHNVKSPNTFEQDMKAKLIFTPSNAFSNDESSNEDVIKKIETPTLNYGLGTIFSKITAINSWINIEPDSSPTQKNPAILGIADIIASSLTVADSGYSLAVSTINSSSDEKKITHTFTIKNMLPIYIIIEKVMPITNCYTNTDSFIIVSGTSSIFSYSCNNVSHAGDELYITIGIGHLNRYKNKSFRICIKHLQSGMRRVTEIMDMDSREIIAPFEKSGILNERRNEVNTQHLLMGTVDEKKRNICLLTTNNTKTINGNIDLVFL